MRSHAKSFVNRTLKAIRGFARRGRGIPSHVSYGTSPATFEDLENRTMLSLLGILPGFPVLAFDSNGVTAYVASAGTFDMTATPLTYRTSATSQPRQVVAPRGLAMEIQVNNSGKLIGGALTGADLTDADLTGAKLPEGVPQLPVGEP